jgi:hypothetical protein
MIIDPDGTLRIPGQITYVFTRVGVAPSAAMRQGGHCGPPPRPRIGARAC